ncbi:glycoside hydrolase superfamily [Aspergillus insuetus]
MKVAQVTGALLACFLSTTSAQLDLWANRAGLDYFGSATDNPGMRERAGWEFKYPKYNAIFANHKEFSSTTPTNGQKWAVIEETEGTLNFTQGDWLVGLAEKQGKSIRCHTLVYWGSFPTWAYSKPWTKESLTRAITDYITSVVSHYKGNCYAWDVANEALNDDGTYHHGYFLYSILGEEWIKLAFRVASQVDPDAKLYYNDAGIEVPGPKADGALRIIRMLKEEGIRIDGIGLQSHLETGKAASIDEYISAINAYGELGLEVALTELDVGIIRPVTKKALAQQKRDYNTIVGACVQAPACIGITLWDFYDPFSWLDYYTNKTQGTLWFENFRKHPAYDGVIGALKNGTRISIRGSQ